MKDFLPLRIAWVVAYQFPWYITKMQRDVLLISPERRIFVKNLDMDVILDLPDGLENELRAEATRNGVSLHHQIIQNLASFHQAKQTAKTREEELSQSITDWISVRQRDRYYKLLQQKKSDRITDDEYQELLLLTNLVEVAHAVRMKHLFDLSALRNMDVLTLMQAFGINNRAEYA